MNRLHVIAAAIEHAIADDRVVLAANLAAQGENSAVVAEHLRATPPVEVLTGGGSLALNDLGITGHDVHGGPPVHVSWRELAGLLTSVTSPATSRDLDAAHRGALSGDPADRRRLAELRATLAYHVEIAAGELSPSLFADGTRERTILDGTTGDNRWGGRVSLLLVDPDGVVCRVNGAMVVHLQSTSAAHRVTVAVLQRRTHDPDAAGAHVRRAWVGTVRHVPPGDSAGSLPATFADRVGVDVLDEGPTAAGWVLQVDGFDVVTMEAKRLTAGAVAVRYAVWDNDPARPNQRFEGHTTVAAPVARRGARDGGAAANRPATAPRPRSEGRGR